jgi:AhpD family alkylhydroperoxidase
VLVNACVHCIRFHCQKFENTKHNTTLRKQLAGSS